MAVMFAAYVPTGDPDWREHDKMRDKSPVTFFVVILIVAIVLGWFFKKRW